MADETKPADKNLANAGAQDEAQEQSGAASSQEGDVDWKDLLRIERDGREKVERENESRKQGIARLERENARLRQGQRDDSEDEEDRPITRGDLENVVDTITSKNRLGSILNEMVKDPSKRDYVLDIYNHRIQRTGTSDTAIRADMEVALTLADSRRITKENAELKRMNESNGTYVPPTGGGGEGGGGRVPTSAHQWSAEQGEALERRALSLGLDPEKYKERTWKEFKNGTAFTVKPRPKT